MAGVVCPARVPTTPRWLPPVLPLLIQGEELFLAFMSLCIATMSPLAAKPPRFVPRAKSIIYLFMPGGPSQLELLDYKPKLKELSGQKIPEEFTRGERFAFIKGDAKIMGPLQEFKQYGQSGT